MSPIGRIFSVLNLVLAAVFLAWASNTLATSADYRAKYEAEVTAKNNLETQRTAEISALRSELAVKAGEASSNAAQRDTVQNDHDRIQGELVAERTKNGELNTSVERLSQYYTELQAQNRDLIAQKDQAFQLKVEAENRAADAESSEQEAKSEAETIKQANLQLTNKISDLEKELVVARKEIDGLGTQVTTLLDRTGATIGDITPRKRIDGAVLKVIYDIEPGLVAINKGSDHGVIPGDTFDIYKGNQYKGRVKVQNVRADMSTCLIMDTYGDAVIDQGDLASTVL